VAEIKRSKKGNDQGRSLTDLAYDAVRSAIEKGTLKAGERVSEYKVAAALKISRTPARECLLRLQGEGLLVSHPRRGLVVASVDREFLKELFVAREVLESAAARLAAWNGSGPELEELAFLLEKQRALDPSDNDGMFEENKVFHNQIYRAAHNRFLSKALLSLQHVISTDRRISSLAYKGRREAILDEHQKLMEAITRRDPESAAQLAAEHIRASYNARLALMEGR